MSTTFGILLFQGVEELDFAGPLEVFGMSRKILPSSHPGPGADGTRLRPSMKA